MKTINLLNFGYVGLVDHMGNDLSVVRSARVSYSAEWRAGEDEGRDEKLINYLMKNKHTSPFESVTFTFEVKAPIFVFRQWHRHRTWSFNEISARYSELPEEFYVPDANQITTQSVNNKQQRTNEELATSNECRDLIYEAGILSFRHYDLSEAGTVLLTQTLAELSLRSR